MFFLTIIEEIIKNISNMTEIDKSDGKPIN